MSPAVAWDDEVRRTQAIVGNDVLNGQQRRLLLALASPRLWSPGCRGHVVAFSCHLQRCTSLSPARLAEVRLQLTALGLVRTVRGSTTGADLQLDLDRLSTLTAADVAAVQPHASRKAS